ncbi:MAG: thioesterase family protein [Cyanobacteria bacterium P01_G01_bin.54]
MPFHYTYTLCLGDTDAAGVMYFARTLHLCHVAYEAALTAVGIPLGRLLKEPELALPITACSARFRRPLYCSEVVTVQVKPESLGEDEFQVLYTLCSPDGTHYAQAETHHTCIHPEQRRRSPLPDWLRAGLVQIAQMD